MKLVGGKIINYYLILLFSTA